MKIINQNMTALIIMAETHRSELSKSEHTTANSEHIVHECASLTVPIANSELHNKLQIMFYKTAQILTDRQRKSGSKE